MSGPSATVEYPSWLTPASIFPPVIPPMENNDAPLAELFQGAGAKDVAVTSDHWARLNSERSHLAVIRKHRTKRKSTGKSTLGLFVHSDVLQAVGVEGRYAAQASWEDGRIGVW